MRILLSNDDGVHAAGIKALHDELAKLGDVFVVAPLEEKSTTGHSLTLHKPLRLISMDKLGSKTRPFYAVSGSPADCVYLGIRQVMGGKLPDLVVSGINRGANLGQDIYYSGTVSAAREACILGIPSIAVSLAINFKKLRSDDDLNYKTAAKSAVRLIRSLVQKRKIHLPHHTMLSLNVPDLPYSRLKGIKVARQGFRFYCGSVLRRVDHRGRDYFWVGGTYQGYKEEDGTDCATVASGYASVTPLKLDSTDLPFLAALSGIEEHGWKPSRPRRRT